MAYNGLYRHLLGPNNVGNMVTPAKHKLQLTVYNGEQAATLGFWALRERSQAATLHYGGTRLTRVHWDQSQV